MSLRNVVLFDLDSVINKFHERFYESFVNKFPYQEIIKPEQQSSWYLEHSYPIDPKEIEPIWQKPGFFMGMEPQPHAVEVISKLIEQNHVAVVTHVPRDDYFSQIKDEKILWLRKVFGKNPPLLHAVQDKSDISGDVLVDDKPKKLILKNCGRKPDWVHIQFIDEKNFLYNQQLLPKDRGDLVANWANKIGRASCRERV